jgi:hypothetical protein
VTKRGEEADDPQWYALRVVPQKEYVVARILERHDVWAYVPTGTTWRKRTRYARAAAEYAKPELAGCIFARFPSAPAWYDVLRNHLIIAPIGRNGEPWQFRARELFSYFSRVPNGTLVISEGESLVSVAGRLLRAPTTQTRIISKRGKPETGEVVEPTKQEAHALQGLVSAPMRVLLAAA